MVSPFYLKNTNHSKSVIKTSVEKPLITRQSFSKSRDSTIKNSNAVMSV
jgi:hypothetical protein